MSSQIATTQLALDSSLNTSFTLLPYREIAISEDGEILVKGKTLFSGYYTQGKVVPQIDAEGYFPTGDLGVQADDGSLTILGRKDNMFISGGENIHPEAIERAINAFSGIRNCVVVAVDNEKYGKRPVAIIDTEQDIDTQQLIQFLQSKLSSYEIPDAFYQWPEITFPFKINRAKLLEFLQTNS
jgi:O-succinylbenzoic acid--CoA ligase